MSGKLVSMARRGLGWIVFGVSEVVVAVLVLVALSLAGLAQLLFDLGSTLAKEKAFTFRMEITIPPAGGEWENEAA